ncbi:hypothetical protein BLNAU_9924 [Blattamonas nauphoetae]|uniref:Uncharacterized protein n=1 Tax=Blattamonas nauphoetae TaxID=2049346 RepID=A0ABQ9XUN7_9EUKA|nr:hypothetical protein BLNAU_9924 [Blattamonas nauphoetae]
MNRVLLRARRRHYAILILDNPSGEPGQMARLFNQELHHRNEGQIKYILSAKVVSIYLAFARPTVTTVDSSKQSNTNPSTLIYRPTQIPDHGKGEVALILPRRVSHR